MWIIGCRGDVVGFPSSLCLCGLSFLAGGEEEAHWKWHCYHSIPGRRWCVVVLQTFHDSIALHPYPSLGQTLSEKWSGNQWRERCQISPLRLKMCGLPLCVIHNQCFPLRLPPDIFALVRYNSQNDSYRWVALVNAVVYVAPAPEHKVFFKVSMMSLI